MNTRQVATVRMVDKRVKALLLAGNGEKMRRAAGCSWFSSEQTSVNRLGKWARQNNEQAPYDCSLDMLERNSVHVLLMSLVRSDKSGEVLKRGGTNASANLSRDASSQPPSVWSPRRQHRFVYE